MANNRWVPLSQELVKHLPFNREYSVVEAVFSVQVDYDRGNNISVSGYSKLWKWSRKRVRTFLKNLGVEILYNDCKRSPKGGQVGVQVVNKKGTRRGQVEFIDFKQLPEEGDKKGTSSEQKGDKKGTTTIDNNITTYKKNSANAPVQNFDKDISFALFWETYPRKVNKKKAEVAWKNIKGLSHEKFKIIMDALEQQKNTAQWKKGKTYIPHPTTWIHGDRWEDVVEDFGDGGKKENTFSEFEKLMKGVKNGSDKESKEIKAANCIGTTWQTVLPLPE